MNYINDNVRRQDRLLMRRMQLIYCIREFGFLSMVETDAKGSGAYGIPISYVDGGKVIYFHCTES